MTLGSPTYTNSTINAGSSVNKGVDIKDLLTNLNKIKSNVKLNPATDKEVKINSELVNKTHFSKTDIDHVRAAINALEKQFSANCNCTQPSSYTMPSFTECREIVKTKIVTKIAECSTYSTIKCQSECSVTCQTFSQCSSACQNVVNCTNQSNQYECSGCQRVKPVYSNCDDCYDNDYDMDDDNGP